MNEKILTPTDIDFLPDSNQVIKQGFYLGHKVFQGKKDPTKVYCFIDLLFLSIYEDKNGVKQEKHTISSLFCDVENEPKGIDRFKKVDCLFETLDDPTRPLQFIRILNK